MASRACVYDEVEKSAAVAGEESWWVLQGKGEGQRSRAEKVRAVVVVRRRGWRRGGWGRVAVVVRDVGLVNWRGR